MSLRSETELLRRERPQAHDLGYSAFLIISSDDLRAAIEARVSECQVKADSCRHPRARAEWLAHLKELRAVLAEG